NESLDAGHEDPAFLEPVLPLEGERIGRLHSRLHVVANLRRPGGDWDRSAETRKGPAGPSPLARHRPSRHASVAAAPAPAAAAPPAGPARRGHESLPALEAEQGEQPRHVRAGAVRARYQLLAVHQPLEGPPAGSAAVLVDRHVRLLSPPLDVALHKLLG